MNKFTEYERMKREFIKKHPNATPEQYELAMKKIARRLGV